VSDNGSRISRVDAWAVDSALPDMEIGGGITKKILMKSVLVRITTEDGLEGFGDSWMHEVDPRVLKAGVLQGLAPLVVGEDANCINGLWDRMWKVARNSGLYPALSALDIALWDLKGRRLGASIAQLLGGPAHDTVEAYATIAWRLPKEELAGLIGAAQGRGFRGAKVAVGHGLEADRVLIEHLRSEVSEILLAVDANGRYDLHDALQVGELCDANGIRWFEEPVPYTSVHDLALVNARVRTPISGFQYDTTIYTMRRHLALDALAIYQPSLDKCGGVTQAFKMSVLADAWGRRFVPHSFAPPLSFAASVQLAAAAPSGGLTEFPVLEINPTDPGRFAFASHLTDAVAMSVDPQGQLSIPDAPGLSVEPDMDRVRDLEIRDS